jgi:hypothetical protein
MAPIAIETYPTPDLEHLKGKASEILAQKTSSIGLIKIPLQLSGAIDEYESFDLTPIIGREFRDVNLVDWLNAPNSEDLIRDLAVTGEQGREA